MIALVMSLQWLHLNFNLNARGGLISVTLLVRVCLSKLKF